MTARLRVFLEKFLGKTVRERPHGILRNDPCHLPVTGRRILAGRKLRKPCKRALRLIRTTADAFDVHETEALQIRTMEFRGPADAAERIAPRIAPVGGIGQRADPHTVYYNDENSFRHFYIPFLPSSSS